MGNDTRNSKLIKYLNLGFDDFVNDLKDFSKIYFPKSSKDLNKASSGQMMIEQASFVGDILSFYLEDRFANSNLITAKDPESIFNNARSLSYALQGPRPARGMVQFYLEVPSKTGSSGNWMPDLSYACKFKNVQLQNGNGIVFEVLEDVDFSIVNISSSDNIRVSRTSNTGRPTHFVLKTEAEAMAGKTVTQTVRVGAYERFKSIEISEPNVIDVLSIVDSDGENWYEVDFLAQETIFEGTVNTAADSQSVPYILKLKTVPRRFVKRINPKTGRCAVIFGTGKASEVGTPMIPRAEDLALDLKGKLTFSPAFLDPQNLLNTRTLGLSPYNTTLTIKARIGGGRVTNSAVNSLREIISKETEFNGTNLDATQLNNTLSSFSSDNESPITGGDEAETLEEIKQNATANFAAQGRVNTREDYIVRTLSLPAKFGKVFRCFAANACDSQGGVQIYVIAKNYLNQLSAPSPTLKKNLRAYLSAFTRLNQGIDILDGRIINLAISYSIVVEPGYNKSKVKMDTFKKVKEFFKVDNWQLNQPIIIDDLRCLISETEGVLSISSLDITNKNNVVDNQTYSDQIFNVPGSTRNNIVFCPGDAIFEVKYPDAGDIKVGAL